MNMKRVFPFVLLVCIMTLIIHYYVLGGSQIQFIQNVKSKGTTVQNCSSYLGNGLYRTVDDMFIEDLKKLCYNTSHQWSGESFDNYFLDHSIKNLECPETKFLKANKPSVALASFPGSGNTWTRQLIEIVTGIHTGSVYNQERETGSKVCPADGSVFIVKTHLTDDRIYHPQCKTIHKHIMNYTKVIYIVRNPYDAILAEFNRLETRSMNVTDAEKFQSTVFRDKVLSLTDRWKYMMEYWLTTSELPTYVIVYERQLSQPVLEMYQMMKFLDLPVKAQSLLCLSTLIERSRRKPAWLKPSNLYDAKLRSVVNTAINDVIESIGPETEIGMVLQNYILV